MDFKTLKYSNQNLFKFIRLSIFDTYRETGRISSDTVGKIYCHLQKKKKINL